MGSVVILVRAQGDSLNMRGAVLHMAADAAGSVGAIVAGVAVLVWHADWVDPAVSILIAGLVLWSAWGLLRDTTNVLLEGTPRGIDPDDVGPALAAEPTVETVHHVHLWSVASDEPALSAHVVLAGEVTLHQAQERGDDLKAMLAERFGIDHATLELECHPCDDPLTAGTHDRRPDRARYPGRLDGRPDSGQLRSRRATAATASSTLASPAAGLSSAASRTQWRMCSSSSPRPTPCRARVTEEIWVRTSMQYCSSSIIFCRPRTCPSMRRSRLT